MRTRITIFITCIFFSSCNFFSAVEYGRTLSKNDNKKLIRTYSISEELKFDYPSEFIEDYLFQIINENNIEFNFEKQGYLDNDKISLTLKDNNGQPFIYNVVCYNATSSFERLDSLLNNPGYKNLAKSYLYILTVTDNKKNTLNLADNSNKKFPNSALNLKLDSLFKVNIENRLIDKLKENKFKKCSSETIKTGPNGIYKLVLSDICTNKLKTIYTYTNKEQTEKYIPGNYKRHLVKIEKFYPNFTLVDSIHELTKVAKYLILKSGEYRKIY